MPGIRQTLINKARGWGQYFRSYMSTDAWREAFRRAPPVDRHLFVTYVPLWKRNHTAGGQHQFIGFFVPELYILAKNDEFRDPDMGLAQQIGLSAFEQAFLLTTDPDHVEKFVRTEYEHRISQGRPLPTYVSKLRVVEDYLRDLTDGPHSPFLTAAQNTQLTQAQQDRFQPRDEMMTLCNDRARAKPLERLMHWFGFAVAKLGGALAVAAILPIATPISIGMSLAMLPLYMVGTRAMAKCIQAYNNYDAAEFIYRELDWLRSPHAKKGKVDGFAVLDVIAKLGVIAVASVTATIGAYSVTANLALWSLLSSTVSGPLSMMAAGSLAAAALAATATGSWFAIRYIDGLSPYDNQIRLEDTGTRLFDKIPKTFSFKSHLSYSGMQNMRTSALSTATSNRPRKAVAKPKVDAASGLTEKQRQQMTALALHAKKAAKARGLTAANDDDEGSIKSTASSRRRVAKK